MRYHIYRDNRESLSLLHDFIWCQHMIVIRFVIVTAWFGLLHCTIYVYIYSICAHLRNCSQSVRWVSIANALANHSYYCFQSIRTTIQVVPLICVCVCVYTRLASFVYMYLCMLMHWKPKFSASALRLSSLYFIWGRTCDKTCSSFVSLYIHLYVQLYISTVFTLPCFCFRYCTQAPTHARTHTHAQRVFTQCHPLVERHQTKGGQHKN